ncbi:unnamed protein product, partial [Symbiodinium microadriaticum]
VRTSIITGDIPLLLSKTVLGKLGMIYDVENGKADFRAINLKDYVLTTTTSGHPAIPIVPVSLPADKMSDLQIEDLRLQTAEQYMSVCAVAHQGPQVPKYFGIFYEKKLDPSTRIMLSEDRLQRDVFVAWWEKANFDRDFWVETPNTWVRVHMVPRDHVDTFMEKSASQKMKGLSSMKHGELVAKAKEMGVDVPDRVTKGNLLRLVRTAVGTTGDTVMTIGRWKGCLYREIPQSYAQWALEETTRTDNSSPELIMFARWWETQMLAKASKTEIKDDESEFEETAQNFRTSTPSRGSASENQVNIRRTSTPSRGSASENQVNIHRTPTSSRGSWDEVSLSYTKEYASHGGKGNTKVTPKRSSYDLKEKNEHTMDSQPDPETLAEIQALETKLALLKDKDCIAEDDYVKGHYNQNTNYNASRYEVVNKDGTPGCRGHNNKHHEHNESQPGARQQLPHPRYGDESFDWADTSFENCQKILEETLAASATGPKRPIQHGEGDDQAHAYVTY